MSYTLDVTITSSLVTADDWIVGYITFSKKRHRVLKTNTLLCIAIKRGYIAFWETESYTSLCRDEIGVKLAM